MKLAPLCFLNAAIGDGISSVRIAGKRIAGIGVPPEPGDQLLDLAGDRLLPGLINAHDHLQLNNFPRTRSREVYENAGEWIADVAARRRRDASLLAAERVPLETRLFLGAVKNLLSGVTTVAHHDPFDGSFAGTGFPVRVLRAYGWAHSLAITSEREIVASYRSTPANWPWIVHAGEGVDARAAAEFQRLEELGCIGANTLLVHGVAFDAARLQRLEAAAAGVIWCPGSNLYLFGRTIDPLPLLAAGQLAFGSDSRLSGTRDLLEELEEAGRCVPDCASHLENLVTQANARLLRLDDRGVIEPGACADLIVLPAGRRLPGVRRHELRLVMIDGVMRYGDAAISAVLGPRADCIPVFVDAREKMLDRGVAAQLEAVEWQEPGLRLESAAWRAA
jgi:cytosine/adenosine deaminase-related metal-dependent hydrolase